MEGRVDPLSAAEVAGESKERKKIHFSVPATVPPQLDPRQVEMIRRRRPTPATLFRVSDNPSPDEENVTHQWVVGENGVLKHKRVNPSVYQPPSLKAVQRMAQAHMQSLGACPRLEDPPEGVESEDSTSSGEESEEGPRIPTVGADSTHRTPLIPQPPQHPQLDSQAEMDTLDSHPEVLLRSEVIVEKSPTSQWAQKEEEEEEVEDDDEDEEEDEEKKEGRGRWE
ncbi:protein phosphatase 1 regulatory subunit 1B isoform X1 [Scleropages formosus]|uniref:protein phosphatase 1 regulatory subunit 1B isoform X1 n=1 Tax=Scleropages formosus TaxID=113540 RepID=UPI0008787AD5|nr:protein phosphatase 1 regulatory subunit 1B isoform X1 [Scleropages formosus]